MSFGENIDSASGLHVPRAVDILVVFKRIIFTEVLQGRSWGLVLVISSFGGICVAEIEDVSVTLPDNAGHKPVLSILSPGHPQLHYDEHSHSVESLWTTLRQEDFWIDLTVSILRTRDGELATYSFSNCTVEIDSVCKTYLISSTVVYNLFDEFVLCKSRLIIAGCSIAEMFDPSCCSLRLHCCQLDAAWMSWRRSGYYRAAERRRELGLPFGRGSEEWIKYLQCVTAGCRDVILWWFLLPPRRVARVRRQWWFRQRVPGCRGIRWSHCWNGLHLSGPQVSIR